MSNVSAEATFVGKKIPNAAQYANFKFNGFTVGMSAKMVEFNFDHSLAGTTISVAGMPKFKLSTKYLPIKGWSVHINCGLPKGVRLNPGFEPLWSGIVGVDFVARQDDELLVKMKEGESFNIFYPNGVVALVSMRSGPVNVVVQPLEPRVALEKRLDFVSGMFEKACVISDPSIRVVRQDRTYHELASMLLFTGIHTDFRKEVCKAVGAAVKNYGSLRPAVWKHFNRVFHTLGDSNTYWWMGGPNSNDESSPAPAPKAGKPATEKARKAARATKSAEERKVMKGQIRSDDSNSHRSKKKAKK